MQRTAPAKINLNLHITGRRDDGYHLLDSIMVFTDWGDDIILKPSDQFRLTADGPYSNIFTAGLLSTDQGSPNLIVKAVYLMAEKAGQNPDFHIHVTKNIPAGAGLGGGSSDAACVMHMLNDYWDMGLSMDELCALGLPLGAELPVCLHGTSSRVTGIGDMIEPAHVPDMHLLIAWPDEMSLTKQVFDHYKAMELPFSSSDPIGDDFIAWLRHGNNDLTAPAIEACLAIADILSDLQMAEGCQIARMSGSGSACFAIFDSKEATDAASRKFKNVIVTTTRTQA